MLQCPFCLKPFKNYHSLQRHANRLSKTAADEGQHKWKLPRVEDITVLQDRTAETAEGEADSKKQMPGSRSEVGISCSLCFCHVTVNH